MKVERHVDKLFDFAFSRRNLVRSGVLGATLALATAAGFGQAQAQGLTDVDILQFALGLEHLTARMYREMVGKNILAGQEQSYLESFASHEATHVQALTDTLLALGATPVAAQSSYNFPAFDSREAILNFAKLVEDTSVGAYQGAAAAINDKTILAAAGRIVQVEARHAAIINLLLGLSPVPSAVTNSLTLDQVNTTVRPLFGL